MDIVHIEHRYYDSDDTVSSASTYNEDVIAFYPSEGFIIFKGYTTLWSERLPCKLNFYRGNSQLDDSYVLYTVQVTKVWRKDLQKRPLKPEEINKEKYKCNHKDEDDCCCNITFFPSYLVIMEFNIIEKETNFTNKSIVDNESICNYCIDDRYSSAKELYTAYTNLCEIPEYASFTNDHRVEDVEFYRGFYDITDKCANMYDLTEEQLEVFKDDLIEYREYRKKLNEKRQKELEEARKQLKTENESKPKNYLSVGAIIGVNSVGESLRNEISDKKSKEDDLIERIMRDIDCQ